MERLPVPSADEAHVVYSVPLEGSTYQLEYRWNGRDGRWYISLLDVDGDPVMLMCPIAVGMDLLATCSSESRPRGALIATVSEDYLSGVGYGELDPGYEDLASGKVRLLYVSASEVEAAANG